MKRIFSYYFLVFNLRICLLLYFVCPLQAQYSNKVWCFGDSAGVIFTNPVSYFTTGEAFLNNSVSIADQSNNLLFYGAPLNATSYNNGQTKRGRIFTRNHTIMTNGDSLIGVGTYHEMLIVPISNYDSTYFVFVARVTNTNSGLYFNLIDLKSQNTFGEVTQKNVAIHSIPMFDGLMAARHGNGKDWWLITRHWDNINLSYSNDFFLYLIDSTAILPQAPQSIGSLRRTNGGDLNFNSDGSKIALCDLEGLIEIYDFDRCTGQLSNPVNIEPSNPTGGFYFSIAFSSNDRFLYLLDFKNTISQNYIYQFDLNSANIQGSKTLIGIIPDSASPVMMKLAPDNKIYISSWSSLPGNSYPYVSGYYNTVNSNLTVINYPDSLSAACDFQLFSFPLGGHRTYRGLPHNPNYELGAWVGSPCDTLSVGVQDPSTPQQAFFQAWYNSEWNMIHVNASKLKGRTGSLRLFDMEGRLVYEKKVEVIAGGYVTTEISMQGIAKGMYIVTLLTEKQYLSGKVMK